jgi:hypothetical protein
LCEDNIAIITTYISELWGGFLTNYPVFAITYYLRGKLLKCIKKKRGVLGTPQTPAGRTLHPFFAPPVAERGKEVFGDTPNPGREDPAPLLSQESR